MQQMAITLRSGLLLSTPAATGTAPHDKEPKRRRCSRSAMAPQSIIERDHRPIKLGICGPDKMNAT